MSTRTRGWILSGLVATSLGLSLVAWTAPATGQLGSPHPFFRSWRPDSLPDFVEGLLALRELPTGRSLTLLGTMRPLEGQSAAKTFKGKSFKPAKSFQPLDPDGTPGRGGFSVKGFAKITPGEIKKAFPKTRIEPGDAGRVKYQAGDNALLVPPLPFRPPPEGPPSKAVKDERPKVAKLAPFRAEFVAKKVTPKTEQWLKKTPKAKLARFANEVEQARRDGKSNTLVLTKQGTINRDFTADFRLKIRIDEGEVKRVILKPKKIQPN